MLQFVWVQATAQVYRAQPKSSSLSFLSLSGHYFSLHKSWFTASLRNKTLLFYLNKDYIPTLIWVEKFKGFLVNHNWNMKLSKCLHGQMSSPFWANFIWANVQMSKIKLGKIFWANVDGQIESAQRSLNHFSCVFVDKSFDWATVAQI